MGVVESRDYGLVKASFASMERVPVSGFSEVLSGY
jgi:hypothetical protein